MRGILVGCAVAVASLSASVASSLGAPGGSTIAVVASITDGDTLRLTSGQRVRLLQIDANERGRCYAAEAGGALERLVPVGSTVTLESDPALDAVDDYGRLLRYVKRSGVNVNIRLVLVGAARPYFYRGERGRYAERLEAAASRARAARRGLWGACGGRGGGLGLVGPAMPAPAAPPAGSCDASYAGGCVPSVEYDLDCTDLRKLGIAPVRVVGPDRHRLDGDGDGFGCE